METMKLLALGNFHTGQVIWISSIDFEMKALSLT